ncbi:MAG: hypothetical protein AAF788_05230 [Pseudomonadota bacterium]
MIRTLPLMALGACAQHPFVSSMNYALEPIDPDCAVQSVHALDGFELIKQSGGFRRTVAEFTAGPIDDLKVIVSNRRNEITEASVVVRPHRDANPASRLASRFAVEIADEAIYVNCTEDGRIYGEPSLIIELKEE